MRKNIWGPLCNVVSNGTNSWVNVFSYGDSCGISEFERNSTVGYLEMSLLNIHTASRAHALSVQHQWASANVPSVFNIPISSLQSPQNWRKHSILQIQEDSANIFLLWLHNFFYINGRSNCQYLPENSLQSYGFYYLRYEKIYFNISNVQIHLYLYAFCLVLGKYKIMWFLKALSNTLVLFMTSGTIRLLTRAKDYITMSAQAWGIAIWVVDWGRPCNTENNFFLLQWVVTVQRFENKLLLNAHC